MIDINKEYKTRDGRPVRLYATDGGGKSPVHGAVKKPYVGWVQTCWTVLGRVWSKGETPGDLIEVRPRIQRSIWLNVYKDCTVGYPSKEKADESADVDRIACVEIKIDCEYGSGLNE